MGRRCEAARHDRCLHRLQGVLFTVFASTLIGTLVPPLGLLNKGPEGR
jgi:hypothetical protein